MDEQQLEQFPESIRDWDEIKNSESPEVFWDRIGNMRKKFGTGLFKPGEDAGEEDWNKFVSKAVELSGNKLAPVNLDDEEQRNILMRNLGVPEDPKEYEFAELEGVELSEDRKEFLRGLAKETNLTKAQLKALDEKVRGADAEALSAQKRAHEESLKELRAEWGLSYDDRVHQAKKVATTFFSHLGDDPTLSAQELVAFYNIAKQFGKSSQEFEDQGDTHRTTMSPQDAAEKIAEIRNNPDHPYHSSQKPGHKEARAKMRELYKIKNSIVD